MVGSTLNGFLYLSNGFFHCKCSRHILESAENYLREICCPSSHFSKIMLKILQSRYQQRMRNVRCTNWIQKNQIPEIALLTSSGQWGRKGGFRKKSMFALCKIQSFWGCNHNKLVKLCPLDYDKLEGTEQ